MSAKKFQNPSNTNTVSKKEVLAEVIAEASKNQDTNGTNGEKIGTADAPTAEHIKAVTFTGDALHTLLKDISLCALTVDNIPNDIIFEETQSNVVPVFNIFEFIMQVATGKVDKSKTYQFSTIPADAKALLDTNGIKYTVPTVEWEHKHIANLSSESAKLLVNELAKLAKSATAKLSAIGCNYKSTGKVDVVYRAYKED